MAAQEPKRENLFLRARAWLRRKCPPFGRKSEVILLPQRVRCFGKRLMLSLPADFYTAEQKKGQLVFSGSKSGLQLTVMRLPFKRALHSISAMDLQLAFGQLPLPDRLPALKRGFLGCSGTGERKNRPALSTSAGDGFPLIIPAYHSGK